MNHLNDKEILDYINIKEFNEQTRELVKKINFHILNCPECAKKVDAYEKTAEMFEVMSRENFKHSDLFRSDFDITADSLRSDDEPIPDGDGEKDED